MPQRPSGATTFGVELRRRRLRAGLSTNGLAALMQYSKGYISKVETGAKSPSLDFARRSDAALAAGGRLIALAQATVRSRRTGRSEELSREIARLESGEESAGARGSPPSGVAASSVAASSVAPKAFADDVGTDHSLQAFRTLLESMRELGQTLSPASIVPMLSPHTAALRELSRRVEPALSREALLLAARFAEFTGWMTQEMGDDVAALRWTDQAVEMAQAAGDQDMVAFAYVRRANIALYQQDSYGTISFAKQAQAMECGPRVRGLAALREAQGHALAGDSMAFRR
jgi:transcriptional regulator with XRE-family HTH domain